jgi:hypothetical protein
MTLSTTSGRAAGPVRSSAPPLPGWLPDDARRYLEHTAHGRSLRDLARAEGCAASTVLRQVRRLESRRDDPLIDEAIARLEGAALAAAPAATPTASSQKDLLPMTQTKPRRSPAAPAQSAAGATDAVVEREARRILRRLSESEAFLAVAPDMEKAVVLREAVPGRTTRTAVVDRTVAHAFALKDWIACWRTGKVTSYRITAAGRAALKRLLAEDQGRRAGFAEAATPFAEQHRCWGERDVIDSPEEGPKRIRYNLAESPLTALARRRDGEGEAFLGPDLVQAGERLREDFELSQMGPRVTQNWERFQSIVDRGSIAPAGGPAEGPRAARERVMAALADLGPGLGDIALRCCCFLEGLEAAEKRLGWSARSGKIVLRIALQRLRRHYEERHGGTARLIG